MTVSDHLNAVRDVLNMAEVPYVDDFYRALAALDAIEAAWNSAYDLPTPRLVAEVERLRGELATLGAAKNEGGVTPEYIRYIKQSEARSLVIENQRLRAELAAAHEAMGKLLDSVRAYHGDPTPSEECAVCIAMREAGAARGDETR